MAKITLNQETGTVSAPQVGAWAVYPKTDGLYIQNSSGVEAKLSTGSASSNGNLTYLRLDTTNGPLTGNLEIFSKFVSGSALYIEHTPTGTSSYPFSSLDILRSNQGGTGSFTSPIITLSTSKNDYGGVLDYASDGDTRLLMNPGATGTLSGYRFDTSFGQPSGTYYANFMTTGSSRFQVGSHSVNIPSTSTYNINGVPVENVTQTLTNKTLTSPVINNATGIGQTRYIIKAANETVNSAGTGATLQNDDDFSFAIAANEKYLVKLWLIVTAANATMDFKAGWSYPASCTAYWQGMGVVNATDGGWATTGVANTITVGIKAINGTQSTATYAGTIGISYVAIITNSSTAGTINFQWAQDTANASDLTVLANSVMEYTRIA